ncbi:MAG: transglutaminase-like domain-containing protein [Planctomycetota bacterium]|jgi:hypothetical protein
MISKKPLVENKVFHLNFLPAVISLFLLFQSNLYAGKYINYVNPVMYDIKHSAVCTNKNITALSTLELNLPIPTRWPELAIRKIKIEGENTSYVNNAEGPGKLVRAFWDSNLPDPNDTKSLKLSYRVAIKEIRTRKSLLEKKTFPPYIINEKFDYYTRPEKMIESDDTAIISIAENIKKTANGPYQYAKAAYDYVIDNITYEKPSSTWTAVQCLDKKKGECVQYAALFVAICRAGKIPARPIPGAWSYGNDPWHCWAEFNLPGIGWIPVDPTVGQQSRYKRKYYFGNLDSSHIPLAKCYAMKLNASRGRKTCEFIQMGSWYYFYPYSAKGRILTVEFTFNGQRLPEQKPPNRNSNRQKPRTRTKYIK